MVQDCLNFLLLEVEEEADATLEGAVELADYFIQLHTQ
jgi:hypothetical protein